MRLPRCRRISIEVDPAPFLRRGWREIEQLVTYERAPTSHVPVWSSHVRRWPYWQAPTIKAMAALSFSDDRLHRDPKVLDDDADKFKAECVEKAHQKRWPILRYDDLGFLIMRPGHDASIIDLMAVLPDARGRGIGTAMVAAFLYFSQAFPLCRAGTQTHNVGAVRMYESLGFREVKRERTFHRP